jgi:glycosyltransferase involved in cell wall biosynthesis
MNILFFSHAFYPKIGGIETISMQLAANFQGRRDVSIIVVTQTKEIGSLFFPFQVVRDPSIIKTVSLLKWCDIVFENNPCFGMSWPNFLLRKPKVVGLHTWIGEPNKKTTFKQKIKKLFLFDYNAVISCSDKIRSFTFKKALVIGNAYDTEIFQRNNSIIKNQDFVFLGRLVSDKGVDMCVELLHELNNKFGKNKSLTIIGDGEEMKRLKELTKSYKLTNQVRFLGFLTGQDIVKVLNAHRFLLVPSRWEEPFGIVALEGMACGCIPIVSDGGGLPDAIGNAGAVFERNSQESFNEVTKGLIENKNLEMKYLTEAVSHLQNHTNEIVSNKYFDVLLKVYNS